MSLCFCRFSVAAAVVRNVTASLSCTLAERLRISGTWAFRGLPGYWSEDTQVRQQQRYMPLRVVTRGFGMFVRCMLRCNDLC